MTERRESPFNHLGKVLHTMSILAQVEIALYPHFFSRVATNLVNG